MPEPHDETPTLTDEDIETRTTSPAGPAMVADAGDDSGDTTDTSDTGDDSGDTSDTSDTGDD
ncbi:MAG TPA: hypothetical protein VK279_05335, partial [Solirubrobacteraceae bacterium]|nr:hypothetical protein [Solirubrobacteraceae bacterium]